MTKRNSSDAHLAIDVLVLVLAVLAGQRVDEGVLDERGEHEEHAAAQPHVDRLRVGHLGDAGSGRRQLRGHRQHRRHTYGGAFV